LLLKFNEVSLLWLKQGLCGVFHAAFLATLEAWHRVWRDGRLCMRLVPAVHRSFTAKKSLVGGQFYGAYELRVVHLVSDSRDFLNPANK
jgi:hypothetical protein